MVQEVIALSIFGSAIIYGLFQLGRYFIPARKKHPEGCGSGSCGCKS